MTSTDLHPTTAEQGPEDELRMKWHQERARHEMTLSSIRGHLDEQPSPRSVRACARRWSADITNLAETVITERQNQETAA